MGTTQRMPGMESELRNQMRGSNANEKLETRNMEKGPTSYITMAKA